MLTQYHRTITKEALRKHFTVEALDNILLGNLGQDNLYGQIGHPHFHFDANAFVAGWAYVDTQRKAVLQALDQGAPRKAWQAFGRLTHALQDFYSHSNYVLLWLTQYTEDASPSPDEIDPVDEQILASQKLQSGKIYFLDYLSIIPCIKRWALTRIPADSHARMNIDAPERSSYFPYTYAAAVKRTRIAFDEILTVLEPSRRKLFTGHGEDRLEV